MSPGGTGRAFSAHIPVCVPSLTRPTAAYVTCQDLRSIVDPAEQMVMVIKAPPETQLQVSDPAEVSWGHALLLLCPP